MTPPSSLATALRSSGGLAALLALTARSMMGLFFGSLLLAEALAFLPGRLLWRVFLG
jgi:uncharacterized membrane protein